jgi:aminoglycoside phosphotransferase (APT) family kinase protein
VSEAVPARDPVETARTLEQWLGARLGTSSVAVSDLSVPKAGFSNETILGVVGWNDADGSHSVEFALRIEPTAHQLFVTPDALRQARVMSTLAGHIRVPPVWLTESDKSVLGAPFFLMDRVRGRIPGDVPSWHQKGWVYELGADEQRGMHDAGLEALARLHGIDTTTPEFAFLENSGQGTQLERYVGHLASWAEWCRPVIRYDAPVIDAALAYVTTETPEDDRRSVMWGDARVGNIIFGDDLSVAAMLDWEGAALGPPELDVAWWIMFDEFLCETQCLRRLPGIPDRAGTLARYEQLSGTTLRDVAYYEVLAGLQFALINSRLADLLISNGRVPESVASTFVTRVTTMIRRDLDRATG